jgi:hypothetical protein
MSLLAALRPDDVDFPLFMHVLGAMVLVGTLLLAGVVLAGAWREGDAAQTRTAYKVLLIGALPAWLVTRVFAQILLDKPIYEAAEESTWVEIGFISTEPALLLLVGAVVAAGVGSRKALRENVAVGTSGRVAAGLTWLLVAIYVVTIWAMTAKPD